MTVSDLKKQLEKLPDNMEVVIHQEDDEFPLMAVQEAKVIKASYAEEPGGKVMAKEKVFLLTDEIDYNS